MKASEEVFEIGRKICHLHIWQKVSRYNFAIDARGSAALIFVQGAYCENDPQKGCLRLFPGVETFHDWLARFRDANYGTALTDDDVRRWVVRAGPKDDVELLSYRPGFSACVPDEAELQFLCPIFRELLGMCLRIDENPELTGDATGAERIFFRREGLDGKWRDARRRFARVNGRVESVTLPKARCEMAAHLPGHRGERWEVDFTAMPQCVTMEEKPRILYVFAGFDARTGGKVFLFRMSVPAFDPSVDVTVDYEPPLRNLWEHLAELLMNVMIERGYHPEAISVRSGRMMRFLRPLGMHVPFKIVQHRQLKVYDAALKAAMINGVP